MNLRASLSAMILALVASVTSATAQDATPSLTRPLIVYSLAAAADVSSTVFTCRQIPQRTRCEENPLVNWMEPAGTGVMLGVGSAFDAAGVWAWQRYVGRRHPKWAAAGLYAVAAIRSGIAIRNIQRGRDWQREGLR